MVFRSLGTLKFILAAGIVTSLARAGWACSVCFGESGDPMVKGVSSGIVALLAVIYGVLFSGLGLTTFLVVRARRRKHADPAP